MKQRDEISHIRITNPNVCRQWVPIRECDVVMDGPVISVSFRVKTRLARRILKSKTLQLFAMVEDGSTYTLCTIQNEHVAWEQLGRRGSMDMGVVFSTTWTGEVTQSWAC